MHRARLGDTPRTLLEEFAKIKSGHVVLPAPLADGTSRTVHRRCVTTSDRAQTVLLNRLGLRLPQHLRYLEEVAQMQWELSPPVGPGAPAKADCGSRVFNLG